MLFNMLQLCDATSVILCQSTILLNVLLYYVNDVQTYLIDDVVTTADPD